MNLYFMILWMILEALHQAFWTSGGVRHPSDCVEVFMRVPRMLMLMLYDLELLQKGAQQLQTNLTPSASTSQLADGCPHTCRTTQTTRCNSALLLSSKYDVTIISIAIGEHC